MTDTNTQTLTIPTVESIKTNTSLTQIYPAVFVLESEKLYKVWQFIMRPIILNGHYPGCSSYKKYSWLRHIQAFVGNETKLYMGTSEYNYYVSNMYQARYRYKIDYPWKSKITENVKNLLEFAVDKNQIVKNEIDLKACWNYIANALASAVKYEDTLYVYQYMVDAIRGGQESVKKEIDEIIEKYLKPVTSKYKLLKTDVQAGNANSYVCKYQFYSKLNSNEPGFSVSVELADTTRDNKKIYYFVVVNTVNYNHTTIPLDKVVDYIDAIKEFVDAKNKCEKEYTDKINHIHFS